MDSSMESVEVAALGRPLHPGMLYDCRTDTVIPGVTLWDSTALSEHLDKHPQVSSEVKFSSSDSVSSKCNLMNISASLKASFLGGLVQIDGAAKYLSDSKSSNQQSRATMFYSETSSFSQLTMAQLGNITYPEVLSKTNATHVVTAVLYGAQASMVFDRTFSEHENQQTIDGELNVMVNKIPTFSIEGHGAVAMNDEDKEKAEKISCTFHGDFRLEQNPTTYLEAIEIYKKLPSMLKDNPQNVVPLSVWLCPLSQLDSSAAKVEREVSSSQMLNIENIVEDLAEVERNICDLFTNPLVNVFSDIKDRVNSFQNSCQIYKMHLLKEVSRVLPVIRGGEQDGQVLVNIVETHNSSPFNGGKLKQWIADAKSELLCLKDNIDMLENCKIEDQNGLRHILLNLDVAVVVSLMFTSLHYKDLYLSRLEEFVKSEANETNSFPADSEEKWFLDPEITAKMRENLSHFRGFSEANEGEKKLCFIISTSSDSSSPGSSIYLYENGKLTDKQFRPVSRPPPPIIKEVQGLAVSLKLQKSLSGETVKYQVEYKEVTSCSGSVKEWVVLGCNEEDFTLTGLEPEKSYSIRYRTVAKLGVSEASEEVSPIFSEADHVTVAKGPGLVICSMTPSVTTIKKISAYFTVVSTDPTHAGVYSWNGIRVEFSDGYTTEIGRHTDNLHKFLLGDGDKLISAALMTCPLVVSGLTGLRLDVEKPDGSRASTVLGGAYGASSVWLSSFVELDVKSGKCYGLKAKVSNNGILISLGFYFI